jgi:hypothetical protein
MRKLLPLALPAAKIPPVLRMLNSERAQVVLFGALRRVEDLFSGLKGGRQ